MPFHICNCVSHFNACSLAPNLYFRGPHHARDVSSLTVTLFTFSLISNTNESTASFIYCGNCARRSSPFWERSFPSWTLAPLSTLTSSIFPSLIIGIVEVRVLTFEKIAYVLVLRLQIQYASWVHQLSYTMCSPPSLDCWSWLPRAATPISTLFSLLISSIWRRLTPPDLFLIPSRLLIRRLCTHVHDDSGLNTRIPALILHCAEFVLNL